jgi:hypothetical protein
MNVIVAEPPTCLLCRQPIGSAMSVQLYAGTEKEWAAHVDCVYAWQREQGKRRRSGSVGGQPRA